MHLTLEAHPSPDEIKANMRRLAALGLVVHVTEMDVRLQQPIADGQLEAQAQLYADVLKACRSQRACQAFVMWGFTDKYSWVPFFVGDFGAAHVFDESYNPKPAYDSLADALH